MKNDPYCDLVLGGWKFDEKLSKKDKKNWVFIRKGEITLHKDHAIAHIEAETFKKQRVHGKVVLIETKLIDRNDSTASMFRSLELTPLSIVENVII